MVKKWDTSQVCIICEKMIPCDCAKITPRATAIDRSSSPIEAIRLAALAAETAAPRPARLTRIVPDDPEPVLVQRQSSNHGIWRQPRSALEAMRSAVSRPAGTVPAGAAGTVQATVTAGAEPDRSVPGDGTGTAPGDTHGQARRDIVPAGSDPDGTVTTAIEMCRPLLGSTGGIVQPDGSVLRLPGRQV